MLKVFNISVPSHIYGRCFRFDFPISGNDEYVVGAFAVIRDSLSDCTGKVSLSSDNGEVIHPSLKFKGFQTYSNANKLMEPVDFAKVGNKLTVIVEEDIDASNGKCNEYQLDVFLKMRKRGK